MKTVMWKNLHNNGLEFCQYFIENELKIRGHVIYYDENSPMIINYSVDCDSEGQTSLVEINQKTNHSNQTIVLQRDINNCWFKDSIEIKAVNGLVDIDIGVTPSTNTLPIRRLKLGKNESKIFQSIWVRFPDMSILPLEQKYTRIEDKIYVYESLKSGYKAEIEVDEYGIVQSYESEWQTVKKKEELA